MPVNCPLCGFKFEESEHNCRVNCPLSKNCNSIKCPNCGYEFVVKSAAVSFIQKIFRKNKPEENI